MTGTPGPVLRGWLPGIAGVLLIGLALAALAVLGGRTLPERAGPPVEQLAVERMTLTAGTIELVLRNTGPDAVQVGQVFVNDAYVDFTGGTAAIGRLRTDTLRLSYPWQDGQPYTISLLTSTGAVIEHEIPVAVLTPAADGGFFAVMALLGTYVGIIPVVLGMALLPLLRRIGPRGVRVLLAVTVGLLAFLAIDATLEGWELVEHGDGAFGGPALVVLGAALAFLVLAAVDRRFTASQNSAQPAQAGGRLALMIAIGIGLHNLGEGLAIGAAYAVGELALGTALVIGFTIQNITEGLAIVAPVTQHRPSLLRLLGLGFLAGAPAIVGAVLGAAVNNAELSALLLGVGVGAIVQVIIQMAPSLRERDSRSLTPATISGLAVGLIVMYLTGLLITA